MTLPSRSSSRSAAVDWEAAAYPTFVGVGARKAGTTLLHSWLVDHPEVCVPADRKEVEFFTRYYERGMAWYRSLFRPTVEKAVGEFSVTYLESAEGIARLARDLPQVKCIVSLRDPVSRLESQFRDLARINAYRGDYQNLVAGHPEVVERGRYGEQLDRLARTFPRERLHVIVCEDLTSAPERVARDLYEFVGVDAAHVPATLRARLNPAGGVRSSAVQRTRQRAKELAINHDLRWLLRLARSRPARRLQSLNAASDRPPAWTMGPDLARDLRRAFEPDVRAVSRFLDRDMSEVWRAGTR
ncbi:MAG: sulfotransferase [Pyrinomonadaceae bacterium]|nr:sulfotransferase [Pyrinomonadaceae bacterium]